MISTPSSIRSACVRCDTMQIRIQYVPSILVLDNPYFTVPDLDGTFRLPDVPAGTYTIAGWHERVGERTGAVKVVAGQLASVDLSLPVEDRP